jgi:hypothetical protein
MEIIFCNVEITKWCFLKICFGMLEKRSTFAAVLRMNRLPYCKPLKIKSYEQRTFRRRKSNSNYGGKFY